MEYGLGKREIDKQFPFNTARLIYKREISFYKKWIPNARKITVTKPFNFLPHLHSLNTDQKQCLEMAKDVIRRTIKGEICFFILTGSGGVGKSTVLYHIGHLLQQHNVNFAIVAPTGIAGQPFHAKTYHGFMGIRKVKQSYASMINEMVSAKTRENVRNLQLIVLEEAFLGGLRALSFLLKRIALIKKSTADQCVSVIVSGDPYQLHNCLDYPLTTLPKAEHDVLTKHAANLYQSAKFKYTLTTNVRQKDDPAYASLLERLKLGEITQEDADLLSSRLISRLSQEERDTFFDSTHIFYSNAAVDAWNFYYLSCLDIPVRKLQAVLTTECRYCRADYPICFIGEGIGLMLQRNYLNEANLSNGSQLTVKHAYYRNDDDLLPEFLTCTAQNYKGPRLSDQTIPISYIEEIIFCPHLQCRIGVKFYPLKNNKSLTMYKVQGLTLSSVVVCFDNIRANVPALYTSLSRVTTLKKLMIVSKKPIESYFVIKSAQ